MVSTCNTAGKKKDDSPILTLAWMEDFGNQMALHMSFERHRGRHSLTRALQVSITFFLIIIDYLKSPNNP